MRFFAMVILILSAFFVISRSQVNEHARFVTRQGEVLEGRVSRDFVTGQYKIETEKNSIRYVSPNDLGAMSSEGSAIPVYAGVIGFLLIFIGGFIGFGLDVTARRVIETRASRASKTADKAIAHRQAELEASVREKLLK